MIGTQELTKDERIQRDVLDELHFDPEVRPTEVGVEVDQGIVTLTGTVDSYQKKWRAAEAALQVEGVRGVANELAIQLPGEHQLTDAEIAAAIAHAVESHVTIPHERVKVAVDHGHVLLEGTVDWHYQRQAAREIVRGTRGVTEITDLLQIKEEERSTISLAEVKRQIERALERNAALEAKHIRVEVSEGTVTLRGYVRSWAERETAAQAAWACSGVGRVANDLQVWP